MRHVIKTSDSKRLAFVAVSCTPTCLLYIRKDISTVKVHCIVGLHHIPQCLPCHKHHIY